MTKANPKLVLLIGVVSVSFAAIFIKLSEAPALTIATYRMLIAFLCLLPWIAVHHIHELRVLTLRDLALSLLSGSFLALHFATWVSAFQYTSVASATVLVATQPIFVVILSYFLLREHITSRQLVGTLLGMTGSIIIGLADTAQSTGTSPLWGNFLALLGAVFAALYFMCGRSVRQRVSLPTYAGLSYGTSALVLTLLALQTGAALYPYSWREFALFTCLAVICTVIGHSTLNWSIKYLPASTIGIAVLGEPIGATLWAFLLFQESISAGQSLGGIMILAGIITFMSKPKKAALQQDAA